MIVKYRRKDIPEIVVEAWRWERGARTDGLEIMEPHLRHSEDGSLFYVDGSYPCCRDERPKDWLGTADREGDVFPFAYYKVREGHKQIAKSDHPAVRRYLAHMGTDEMPLPTVFAWGRYPHMQSERRFVSIGDWIVEEPHGMGLFPCRPKDFEAIYEPAGAFAPDDGGNRP